MTDNQTHPAKLAQLWQTQLDPGWQQVLASLPESSSFQQIGEFLDTEWQNQQVLPTQDLIFNAFTQTPFESVKVIILGQDPYPNQSYAHGLAFSVPPDVRIPGSLLNIFKEIQRDLKLSLRHDGCLLDWAQQGILLLNTCLTVRVNAPGSHFGHGWEALTDRVVHILSTEKEHVVFLLWGNYAIKRETLIDHTRHLVVKSSHPSFRAFDRPCGNYPPFLGSHPFSQTNDYLITHEKSPISWAQPHPEF